MRVGYDVDIFLFGEGELIKEISNSVEILHGTKALRLVATPFREVLKSPKKSDIIYRILLMILVRLTGPDRFYNWLFKKQKNLGNYDIAISYFNDVPHSYFNQGTNKYVLEYVNAPTKLAWIHTDPIQAGFEKENCRELYKNFDSLVCVSKACAVNLQNFLPEFTSKIKTVYNFFPIEEIQIKAKEKNETTDLRWDSSMLSLVTVTRIDNGSKNLSRIVEVCKMLEGEGIKNYKWTIVGDGPDLENNRREIEKAGLSNRVNYIGQRTNPYPFIAGSDLFILTSNYEGYPMVVQEALILGIPVLTTPYAAAREQITDGVNGIITEMNTESLFSNMRILLGNPILLDILKANIKDYPVSNQTASLQLSKILDNQIA